MSDRRTFVAKTGGLAAAAMMSLGLFAGVASAQDATATPAATAGVLGDAVAATDCTVATPVASVTYVIDSANSTASYKAEEELAQQGANTAVGTTNAFIGQILLDENGKPIDCTQFAVDLRTLTSDSSRRDNFLYDNTLETGTYPLAIFQLTSVQGLDSGLKEGEEATFYLIGNLTLHGVTKSVAWEAKATLQGDQVTGTATTNFDMPDFGIQEPVVGPVISVDENVTLEVDIVATKAA